MAKKGRSAAWMAKIRKLRGKGKKSHKRHNKKIRKMISNKYSLY